MSPQNPASPDIRSRPVDWLTWSLWILVCAAEPVLYTAASTAVNKRVLPEDPHAGLILGLVAVVLLMPLAVPVLQWVALRRAAPRLNLGIWFAGFLAAGFIWIVLELLFYGGSQRSHDLRPRRRPDAAHRPVPEKWSCRKLGRA